MSKRLYKYYTFSKDSDLDKRSHEEITAKLVQKILSNYTLPVSKDGLDKMYETVNDLPKEVERKVRSILREGDKMAEKTGKLSKMLSKNLLLNLYDFIHTIIHDEKLKIIDHKECFRNFLDMDARFTTPLIVTGKQVFTQHL